MANTPDENCQFYQEGVADAQRGLAKDLEGLPPKQARSYCAGYEREYAEMMCFDYGFWELD